ncbi:hypothetical protein, partial [Mucilaginibacter sp.]|uniref:hypothetical protein n=1 Tax=Mucilaginibacter sp. TaxID=1882438 RepID=UPI003264B6D9
MKNSFCILIVAFSFILIGCREKSSLTTYNLKEIGAVIKLPASYKAADRNNIDRLINKQADENIKNEFTKRLLSDTGSKLLIDTLNPLKFIFISKITPYAPIDSNSFYFIIDHERSRSSSKPDINDSTYYVGSKMGSVSGFKFMESKYR